MIYNFKLELRQILGDFVLIPRFVDSAHYIVKMGDNYQSIVEKEALAKDEKEEARDVFWLLEVDCKDEVEFSKGIRLLSDLIARCGYHFYICGISRSIQCYIPKAWHDLIFKVLLNNGFSIRPVERN